MATINLSLLGAEDATAYYRLLTGRDPFMLVWQDENGAFWVEAAHVDMSAVAGALACVLLGVLQSGDVDDETLGHASVLLKDVLAR